MAENNFFKWNQQLLLNVTTMDNEHQKLINLMNELYSLSSDMTKLNAAISKLNELYQYTQDHFAHEEKYFSSIAYEKANVHKNIHKDLLRKLKDHADKVAQSRKVHPELFSFLKTWLTAHIMGIDTGYAQVANGQSKSA